MAALHNSIYNTLTLIKRNKIVFRSILDATWFWTSGAFIAVQIYPLAGHILHADNVVITFFLILFSTGINVSSLLYLKKAGKPVLSETAK